MSPIPSSVSMPGELPELLREFFWDCNFDRLSWAEHCEFLTRRILSAGSWDAVCWLRSRLDDHALREWIERHQGRWLSPPQLQFWELVLDLPSALVDTWLDSEGRRIWEGRYRR
jgi:hypothetical protein